jgi:hypothetical protein
MVDFYLMHYKTEHFTFQIDNIRKYVTDDNVNIYVTVDSDNIEDYEKTLQILTEMGNVNIIKMPFPRLSEPPLPGWHISCSEYGLACNYIYNNYIKQSNNISIMMENDVFFYDKISITEYTENYQVVGNIRINYNHLPNRIFHLWPGFLIFNTNFTNRELFGLKHGLVKGISTDSGAESHYWLEKNKNNVKHIKYIGESENYSPFHSVQNEGRYASIDDMPVMLKNGYKNEYKVVLLDNKIIHLEGMGKSYNLDKINWIISVL